MKYMLLIQASERIDAPPIHTWKPTEIEAHIQFMQDFNAKLAADGELVDAQGLTGPEEARVVRSTASGVPQVTDGPFPESKEYLAGFWIIDVDSLDRAIEVAAAASAAPGPEGRPVNMPIEVRRVGEAPAQDV